MLGTVAVNQLDSSEHSSIELVVQHLVVERQYRDLVSVDLREADEASDLPARDLREASEARDLPSKDLRESGEARDLAVRALLHVFSVPEPDKCT